jgi:hypothetical protein
VASLAMGVDVGVADRRRRLPDEEDKPRAPATEDGMATASRATALALAQREDLRGGGRRVEHGGRR